MDSDPNYTLDCEEPDIGLLPQSYTPNAYPYLPSINPGVNFFLGQPTVTVLSVLGGAVGDVLELIPPA